MFSKLIALVGVAAGIAAFPVHAQSHCLSYPSGSTPPSGYAASWDVFSAAKELLVKVNCPSSGTSLTLTVGKGDSSQLVYNTAYTYNGSWQPQTLAGSAASGSWLTGVGTKEIAAPASASAGAPMYIVGYVCTNRSGTWKCGCENTACTTGKWQLQGYTGTGGGTTAATTGGTTGGGIGGTNPSGLPWKSGAGPGTNIGSDALEKAQGFGQWRGRAVDVQPFFIGQNSWPESYQAMLDNPVLGPSGGPAVVSQHGIMPTLTIPLVTSADAGKFAMVASGAIDDEHRAIANKLKNSMGGRRVYLRIGHEADEGYPWSYTGHGGAGQPDPANPTDYKNAWRRIARIYKDTIPNAVIVWNVLKNTRGRITDYYPGDDVVDILSIDPYDNGSGGFCDSATSAGWINMCVGDYNPATGVSKGIGGLLEFARSRGKKIAVDEWGASNKSLTAGDGANNSFYVQGMYDFFMANAQHIEYESYYNRAGGGKHQIWPRVEYNARPSDAYLAKWRP